MAAPLTGCFSLQMGTTLRVITEGLMKCLYAMTAAFVLKRQQGCCWQSVSCGWFAPMSDSDLPFANRQEPEPITHTTRTLHTIPVLWNLVSVFGERAEVKCVTRICSSAGCAYAG